MPNLFEAFGATPLGEEIAAVILTPNRQIEFDAFSREGFPAVTALVSELTPILETLREKEPAKFNAAKQFVGWYVGEMMRNAGRTMIKPAKSVPGKLFRVGALWSYGV